MGITYRSLLVGGAKGWHDGSKTLTWAVLPAGGAPPGYYPVIDTDRDGTADAWYLSGDRGRDTDYVLPFGRTLTAVNASLAALAVQAWNEVANINLIPATGAASTADITFGSYGSLSRGLFGHVADFPSRPGVPSTHGDVWVNSNLRLQAQAAYGDTGWQTYLHELGHGLGLHHPNEDPNNDRRSPGNDNQFTVMSYLPHPSVRDFGVAQQPWPLTPMMLDIQAAQALYGVNTQTRDGDTTYFGPRVRGSDETAYALDSRGRLSGGGPSAMLTVWDGGGEDTINAANQSAAVRIDLNPGAFCTIGPIRDAIGIALEAEVRGEVVNVIENAVGGRGADTIVGNAAANRIAGGDGGDRIEGGAGEDILIGGAGRDQLDGGAGADVFRFEGAFDSTQSAADFIEGFSRLDSIDLSALDADTTTVRRDGFELVATLTEAAAEAGLICVRWNGDDRSTLYANTDDDARFEAVIRIDGRVTADDLVL